MHFVYLYLHQHMVDSLLLHLYSQYYFEVDSLHYQDLSRCLSHFERQLLVSHYQFEQ